MTTEIILRILTNPVAIAAVVLFFGASIFVHELGHYLAARWRGLKIDRFSIGFGPRLFGWRDKQGVEWRVAPIPLGGYVMLPQLADLRGAEGESPETRRSGLPPISYTDKMVVSVAGAVYNVLFALSLACILWVAGTRVYDSMDTTQIGYVLPKVVDRAGNEVPSPASKAGILPGDTILAIDGQRVDDWGDVVTRVTTGSARADAGEPLTRLTVDRGGETLDIAVFPVLSEHETLRIIGFMAAEPVVVDRVFDNSPGQLAGLEQGDQIIAVNGERIYRPDAFIERVNDHPDEGFVLTILREGQTLERFLRPENVVYTQAGDTRPMVGIAFARSYEMRHIDPFTQLRNHVDMTVRVLAALFNPHTNVGVRNLSGPVGIGYALYSLTQIGMRELLAIVVLININLAILNLLPIPVLDGGHMVFATLAKLRGKPLPASFVAAAQSAFMLFFIGIFIYVTFFDTGRVHRNESAIIEQERAAAQRVEPVFTGESMEDVDSADPPTRGDP
ncbi:MAG: RIP metalloprotease RseP [Opitutales bacterium]|nr:RIP metalloprotease RseP [Opitutales bacterium]